MTASEPAPARSFPLLDASAASAGDQAAVDAGGTWAGLMERAAGHLARGIVAAAGYGYGLRVTLVVGKGNNGGDGWAAARRLRDLGAAPRVVAVHGLDVDLSDEADANRTRFLRSGGRADGPEVLDRALDGCDVAVDCLLGTGASGAPRGVVGGAVEALLAASGHGTIVVACDVPTGVQADDGLVPGDAVRADATVTFGGLKRGLVLHPGAVHAGRVTIGELGPGYAPPDVTWQALTAAGARPATLDANADKRARGQVLVVAGSRGMAGAAILAARGALAGGAGLVTVAVPRCIQDVVAPELPSAITIGLEDQDGGVAAAAAETLAERAGSFDAVIAGPGLRPTAGTREVVDALRTSARRLVLDADGLNVHRGDGGALAGHDGELVLTPHVRELARISDDGDGDGDVWDRRVTLVPELAGRLGATVVAKGPGTIIAASDGRTWVTPTGGPALAAGGTGDVLAGLIAATIATAEDTALGTATACWWHGVAGDLAGSGAAGRATSVAVADRLPEALARTDRLAVQRPTWPFDDPGWHVRRVAP